MSRSLRSLAGNVALAIAATGALLVPSPRALAAAGDIHTFAGHSVGAMTFGDDQIFISAPGPRGDGGPAVDAALLGPADVAFDSSGNAYIADRGDARIRKVDPAGTIDTFVTSSAPVAVAVAPNGTDVYWVDEADHKVYRWWTPPFGGPGVEHVAGSGVTAYAGDGGPAVAAGLDPADIAFDGAGNLLIVDAGNHRIRKVDEDGIISTFAGSGGTGMSGPYVLCDADSGNGGAATAAKICHPGDIAVDSAGRVYVTTHPYAAHIRRIGLDGRISNFLGTGECVIYMSLGVTRQNATPCAINDLAVDGRGNVYLTVPFFDVTPYVLRVDAFNGLVTRVAGKGCSYFAGGGGHVGCFSGDDGPALLAGLDSPMGVHVRGDGSTYFADSRNLRVRVIEPYGYPSVIPLALGFANTEVGLPSATMTASVRNSAYAPLHVGSLALEGANAADFSLATDGCSGRTLAPGAWCETKLLFAPTGAGARAAFLHVPTDGPEAAESRFGVTLAGTGITVPRLAITPTPAAFGNHPTGSTTTKTLTMSSVGTAPVAVGVASIGGMAAADYAIGADACSGATLAPSATCTIDVAFTPTVRGFRNATLNVPTDAGAATVPLTGSAGPLVSVSPGSIAFGNVAVGAASPAKTVTVTNTGSEALVVSSAAIAGSAAGQYRVVSDGCSGSPVAPAASCSVGVVFEPAALGFHAAALRVSSDAATPVVDIALGGNGVDVVRPVSAFTTPNDAVVVRFLDEVTGTATDDLSGVSAVRLTFRSEAGSPRIVSASLICNASRTTCTWTARIPTSIVGPVTVHTAARDAAGNHEIAGPMIRLTVL